MSTRPTAAASICLAGFLALAPASGDQSFADPPSGPAEVWYVDAGATGPTHDGRTWCNAFTNLQDGLAAATDGDAIRIADGTYTPDQGAGQTSGDRMATFQLLSGVSVLGGYAGCGAPDPDERNVGAYETILSGDVLGNDSPVACTQSWPDCGSYGMRCLGDGFCIMPANNGENSYHVLTTSGTRPTAVLDGVTITGGNANGSYPHSCGGGIYSHVGSPTIANCTITRNTSGGGSGTGGGGVYCYGGRPTIEGCTISGNTANEGAGGGIYSDYASPLIRSCLIEDCTCEYLMDFDPAGGGGIYCVGGAPQIAANRIVACVAEVSCLDGGGAIGFRETDILIRGNEILDCYAHGLGGGIAGADSHVGISRNIIAGCSGWHYGGGLALTDVSGRLSNNLIIGNDTPDVCGGGILVWGGGSGLEIAFCTIAANAAPTEWEWCSGGGIHVDSAAPLIHDCIFWGNTAYQGAQIWPESLYTVTYCNVQDGWPGLGNIDADPLFVDADGPDNDPETCEDNDYRLSPGSPCIDAGDNTKVIAGALDLDGNYRRWDDPATTDTGNGDPPVVDMGVYEFGSPAAPDCNGNGLDDDGEVHPALAAPYPDNRPRNRYLSFDPDKLENDGLNVAFKVELKTLTLGSCDGSGDPDVEGWPCRTDDDCRACNGNGNACWTAPLHCPTGETCDLTGAQCVNDQAGSAGRIWWVGPEHPTLGNDVHLLVSEPYRKVSTAWPAVVYVSDCEIVPIAIYGVRAVNLDADLESAELEVSTISKPDYRWADCVGPLGLHCTGDWTTCTGDGDCPAGESCLEQWPPPDGIINFQDVTAAVLTFSRRPGLTITDLKNLDLHGNDGGDATIDPPNHVVNFADVANIVMAFQGWPYPYSDPGDCPDVDVWP